MMMTGEDARNEQYSMGVLVQNPNTVNASFRGRMGYRDPDAGLTKTINYTTRGDPVLEFKRKRGEKETKNGQRLGLPPNWDPQTLFYQQRVEKQGPPLGTSRQNMIHPHWQVATNAFGGNSGTIEMLAGGHNQPLPFANDNLDEVTIGALEEHHRNAANDPFSNAYALKANRDVLEDFQATVHLEKEKDEERYDHTHEDVQDSQEKQEQSKHEAHVSSLGGGGSSGGGASVNNYQTPTGRDLDSDEEEPSERSTLPVGSQIRATNLFSSLGHPRGGPVARGGRGREVTPVKITPRKTRSGLEYRVVRPPIGI